MAGNHHSRSAAPPGESLAPRRRPRQLRSRRMVEDILEAAARVLAERGYEGCTTLAVADRAGVSVGSLYQYFPGKAALAASLYRLHRSRVAAAVAGALERCREGGAEGAIRGVVRAMWDAHQSHSGLHRVLEEAFPGRHRVEASDEVRRALEKGMARPEFAGMPPSAGGVVLVLIRSLVHAAVLNQGGLWEGLDPVEEISRAALGYLERSRGGPGPCGTGLH